MIPLLVDTHCHLHFPPFNEDVDQVLARMREKNMWGITIGTSLANSERGIRFAEEHEGIWATVGLHPEHFTSDFHDEQEGEVHEDVLDVEQLKRLAQSSKKVVGIGETGLDFFRIDEGKDVVESRLKQERAFSEHYQVAHEVDLPLVIHCRDGLTRLAALVQEQQVQGKKVRGVVHSFTGTWGEAQPLLDLGFYVAVNGIATFPLRKTQKSEDAIDRTIERIPLDRLLLETDAPYLAPMPYRGTRNEPPYVEEVAKHVARLRGMELEHVKRQTTQNAIELFHLE